MKSLTVRKITALLLCTGLIAMSFTGCKTAVKEEKTEEIEEETIQTSEDTNEAITGPSAPVSGPVVAGPMVTGGDSDEDEIFQVVEQMPEFPGGMEALLQYLGKNIKYPASAQENGIQGKSII